jgi:hypothetical protein
VGALHHPSTSSGPEELTVPLRRFSAPSDVALERVGITELLDLREVVPLVEAHSLADPSGRAEGPGVEGPLDQLAVVPIGRSDLKTEGHSSTVGEETALDTGLPSVGGVGTRPLAAEGSFGHRAIHALPAPPHAGLVVVELQRFPPGHLEQTDGTPLLESVVEGALGSEGLRESRPLNAGSEEIEDPGETPSIVHARTPSSRRRRVSREQRGDSSPEDIRDIELDRSAADREHSEHLDRQGVNPGFHSKWVSG